MANLAPDSKTVIHHTTKPEKQLGGRSILVSTGGLLGGGSSANMTTYSRPQCSDFDAWNMPGWSAEEMMPFVKKVILPLTVWVELYGLTDVMLHVARDV